MQNCEQFQPKAMITIFDSAAQKSCPLYWGTAIKVYDGWSDLLYLELSKQEKLQAFMQCVEPRKCRFDAVFEVGLSIFKSSK